MQHQGHLSHIAQVYIQSGTNWWPLNIFIAFIHLFVNLLAIKFIFLSLGCDDKGQNIKNNEHVANWFVIDSGTVTMLVLIVTIVKRIAVYHFRNLIWCFLFKDSLDVGHKKKIESTSKEFEFNTIFFVFNSKYLVVYLCGT